MTYELRPIVQRRAGEFVDAHHRHNRRPAGWLFGTSLLAEGQLVAVGYAGRPLAKSLQDGRTVEITRVCSLGARNACSMMYGALCRAAKALGYQRAVTYTLASEPGVSLRAAGFRVVAAVELREWSRPKRHRVTQHTVAARVRWEREL